MAGLDSTSELWVATSTGCATNLVQVGSGNPEPALAYLVEGTPATTLGPDLQILAAGDVTLTAPLVTFVNDVETAGTLRVDSAIP